MSIILSHIHKQFGTQEVIRDLSLEINERELFVLLGSSGSGKSTLLRMIAGLTDLDAGTIVLNGTDVTHLPPQKRGTGFVFQNYSLFRHMTVAENIAFGLSIRKVSRADRCKRVAELLELIGLPEYGDRLPTQLSGGQQQRVALARALAYEPTVLLLDEPFGALDVKIRSQLRQNLRDIQKRLGLTAILVTHDQDEAFELADRIGIIEQGHLLEVGTPSELYRRPQHRFTATFLGNANLFDARRNGSYVYLGDVKIPAPPNTEHLSGQPVEIMLRPEEVEIALAPDDLSGNLLGRGTVIETAFLGATERVTVALDGRDPIQVLLNPDTIRTLHLVPGSPIWVGVREYHLLRVK